MKNSESARSYRKYSSSSKQFQQQLSPHNYSNSQICDLSVIQQCYQQQKVSLFSQQQLITSESFYICFTIQQIPNHKIYIMYITNYRIYLTSTLSSQTFMIPHAYIKDYICYDNQIRLVLKTGLKIFMFPEETNRTTLIYQFLMRGAKQITTSLKTKHIQEQTDIYDCLVEMDRMLINWKRYLAIENKTGGICVSYPKTIFVSSKLNKQTVKQCQKSRINARIPVLVHYEKQNKVSVWRCGHLCKQHNTKYDLSYLQSISQNLLIIQIEQNGGKRQSICGGFNHFNNQIKYTSYKFDSMFLVRQNYQRMLQSYLKNQTSATLLKSSSKWLEQVDDLIKCAFKMCQYMKNKRHILIQQNDMVNTQNNYYNNQESLYSKGGIDRASQITSLIQIISDGYYRTIKGLFVLLEKNFISFGYPFYDRCGYAKEKQTKVTPTKKMQQSLIQSVYKQNTTLKSSVKSSQISHTFIQFLQCINQLLNCYPTNFEYSSQFLAHLGYQLYSAKYNNFLFNTIYDRQKSHLKNCTKSIYTNCPMKKKYYNLQFFKRQFDQGIRCSNNSNKSNGQDKSKKSYLKSLLDFRSGMVPRMKQFIIWKQYWQKVTKMNAQENQRDQSSEIQQMRQILFKKFQNNRKREEKVSQIE